MVIASALACIMLIFIFFKNKRMLLSMLVIVIAFIVIYFLCGNNKNSTYAHTVNNLEAGKTYLWKVMVYDGKGGSAESETWKFEMKK
jgi:uncharacterized membrane protein YgaE (UPF0421/DUF939 family)